MTDVGRYKGLICAPGKNKEKYKIICLNLLATVLKIVRCEAQKTNGGKNQASTERTEQVVQIPWFEPESNTEDQNKLGSRYIWTLIRCLLGIVART